MVDTDTGRVDETICERAALKIEKARKMAAEENTSKTTIFYAESALDDFGPAIAPEVQAAIRKRVKRLEEMDEHGTYEENVRALDDLRDVLNKRLGTVVNLLMEVKKAGDFCMDTDPSKAPKFYQYIDDILDSFRAGKGDRAASLLSEIMPEVYDVVNKYEAKTGVIYKDIKR
ncbi:MAG TPA: hypothetical protein ENF70_07255 [Deltaproteobacteria bacterium]|nr:hypothetical protein [Deltaproteobacteria bacterium]